MNPTRVTLHQDGTFTYWDPSARAPARARDLTDAIAAVLTGTARARVRKHVAENAGRAREAEDAEG